MLDRDETLAIRASWSGAADQTPAIAAALVTCVGQRAPRLGRRLRRSTPANAEGELRRFVDAAVATIGDPRRLVRLLRDVARTPAAAALSEDDARVLGSCFLCALTTVLGDRLDARSRVAWQEAVTLLVAVMARLAATPVRPQADA